MQRHLRTDFESLYTLLGDDWLLHDAFDVADRAHAGQMRTLVNGQVPYILHPLFVFFLLRSWGVTDRATLASALLHDSVEDGPDEVWRCTAPPFSDGSIPESPTARALFGLEQHFGEDVSDTVDGVTNRKGIPYVEKVSESTKKPRVLILKLADFTHNALMLDPRHPRADKLEAKYTPLKPVLATRLQENAEAQAMLPAWRDVLASLA